MSSKSSAKRPLQIGIVANEFFDKDYTRMGGFGWAAKRAAEVLNSDPFFFPYFLSSKIVQDGKHNQLHGIPVEQITGNRIKRAFSLLSKKIDLFFTIDYRTSYNSVLNALPYLPVITWVRDPRSPEDVKKILTLKIPGDPNGIPRGISPIPTDELVQIKNRWPFHRKVILANKIPHMKEKNLDTYGLPGSDYILPNPSVLNYRKTSVEKNEEPLVVYLGRLDPIKRPWLFVDLARHLPDVRFLMMGKSHFTGNGAWNPVDVPENVTFLGHTDQKEKWKFYQKHGFWSTHRFMRSHPFQYLRRSRWKLLLSLMKTGAEL